MPVPIASMTGFARAEGAQDGIGWAWELKSVNGKSLDLRLRVPAGYDHLEPALRTSLARRLRRGSVSATLALQRASGTGPAIRVNQAALDQIMAVIADLEGRTGAAAPRLDGILGLRGVLETTDEEVETTEQRDRRGAAILGSWELALAQLAETREAEGARLALVLREQIAEIAALVATASACAATQPAALRARLRQLVQTLLDASPALPEERLAQEAALLVARADVREELDRLKAHLGAAEDLMREGVAVGRRFDFLCQEFNREANTLCSKSADVELTRTGLALKAAIEQLREQVQNIE
jgi:uncharacterized protein (TIGR00255 family)